MNNFFNNIKTFFKLNILLNVFLPLNVFCDCIENWQIGFQDPATPIMEGIINLHHDLMFFISVISVFVTWMLFRTLWHFNLIEARQAKT